MQRKIGDGLMVCAIRVGKARRNHILTLSVEFPAKRRLLGMCWKF